MNFQIISDSACDLLPSFQEANQIMTVPFYVSFDKKTYYKEGVAFNHDAFYKKMDEEHAIPVSSLPSISDYMDAFLPHIKQQIPIICICITSKFSGSYNSACNAKNQLLESYPDAKIAVIDSTLNTVTQGLFVYEAVRMRNNGLSFEEAAAHLETIKQSGRIYFTVGSLEYLVKNGRIGKLAMLAGDKLGIKPLIIMKDGEISLGGITRSRAKTKKKILEQIQKYFEENHLSPADYTFKVGTGFDYKEAKDFSDSLEQLLHIRVSDIDAVIGTTVGCHTGPHPIGVGFLKKYDA